MPFKLDRRAGDAKTGLHPDEERIAPPLVADAACRAVAAEKADIVAQRQNLVADRGEQRLMVAAGQIGAADRAVEENVAEDRKARLAMNEDYMARRMARRFLVPDRAK